MGTYYDQKKETIKLIEKLASLGKYNSEDIAFMVEKETGFSEKFIKKFINESVFRDIFKKNKEGILNVSG